MPQFYVAPENMRGGRFRLFGAEAFHVVRVLRCVRGQALTLFDGRGGRFEGVIEEIAPDGSVNGRISSTLAGATRVGTRLTLCLGLLKAGPWDYALEKGTELGVSAFVPLLTPRTVVLFHAVERRRAKRERWGRVIMAAAKQCGRAELPAVAEPALLRDAVRALKSRGPILLAWEGMQGACAAQTLRPALLQARASGGAPLELSLFIGPEGGFTEDEVALARAEGALVFGLGPRVLRAETAALAAAALVQYELGAL